MTREEEIKIAASKYMENNSIDGYVQVSDHKDSFIEGAEWSDRNPKSPWIDVKEKLPYNNPIFIHFGFTNRVLVREKKGNLFVAYMKKNKDNEWIWCNGIDDNFDLLSCITHWMPIPYLPKE